jgi:hypothetical protein
MDPFRCVFPPASQSSNSIGNKNLMDRSQSKGIVATTNVISLVNGQSVASVLFNDN